MGSSSSASSSSSSSTSLSSCQPAWLLANGSQSPSTVLTVETINALLIGHNDARVNVTTPLPATALPMLRWNQQLADFAQGYEDSCPGPVHPSVSQRSNVGGWSLVGSNTAAGSGPSWASSPLNGARSAVKYWTDQKEYYTFNSYGGGSDCASGKVCLGYSQVIWALSVEVGCGFKYCGATQAEDYYWLCVYGAAGNRFGKWPYVELAPATSSRSSGSGTAGPTQEPLAPYCPAVPIPTTSKATSMSSSNSSGPSSSIPSSGSSSSGVLSSLGGGSSSLNPTTTSPPPTTTAATTEVPTTTAATTEVPTTTAATTEVPTTLAPTVVSSSSSVDQAAIDASSSSSSTTRTTLGSTVTSVSSSGRSAGSMTGGSSGSGATNAPPGNSTFTNCTPPSTSEAPVAATPLVSDQLFQDTQEEGGGGEEAPTRKSLVFTLRNPHLLNEGGIGLYTGSVPLGDTLPKDLFQIRVIPPPEEGEDGAARGSGLRQGNARGIQIYATITGGRSGSSLNLTRVNSSTFMLTVRTHLGYQIDGPQGETFSIELLPAYFAACPTYWRGHGPMVIATVHVTSTPSAEVEATRSAVTIVSGAAMVAALAGSSSSALDMQSLAVVGLLSCAGPLEAHVLKNNRLLAPLATGHTYGAMILGNWILLCGFALGHAMGVGVMLKCKKLRTWEEALGEARHPSLTIMAGNLLYQGTGAAAIKLVQVTNVGHSDALVALIALLLAGALPLFLYGFARWSITATFNEYQHEQRRPPKKPLPKVLRFLLPRGRWMDPTPRRRYSTLFSDLGRFEYIWVWVALWSPLLMLLGLAFNPRSVYGCSALFGAMAVVEVLIALIFLILRPYHNPVSNLLSALTNVALGIILYASALRSRSLLLLAVQATTGLAGARLIWTGIQFIVESKILSKLPRKPIVPQGVWVGRRRQPEKLTLEGGADEPEEGVEMGTTRVNGSDDGGEELGNLLTMREAQSSSPPPEQQYGNSDIDDKRRKKDEAQRVPIVLQYRRNGGSVAPSNSTGTGGNKLLHGLTGLLPPTPAILERNKKNHTRFEFDKEGVDLEDDNRGCHTQADAKELHEKENARRKAAAHATAERAMVVRSNVPSSLSSAPASDGVDEKIILDDI